MSQDHVPGAIYLTEEDVVRLLPMTDAIEAVELAFRHLGRRRRGQPVLVIALRSEVASSISWPGRDQTQGYLGYKAYGGFRGHWAGMMVTLLQHREWAGAGDDGGKPAGADPYRRGERSGRRGTWRGWGRRWWASWGTGVSGCHAACGRGRRSGRYKKCASSAATSSAGSGLRPRWETQLGLTVRAVDTAEAAVSGADIVNVITNSATPVLRGAWLAPGTHINAAGCNVISHREIDVETVRRADLVVADSVEQARP